MHAAPWRTVRGRLVLAALFIEFVMLAILVGNSLRLLREAMGEQAREQAQQIAPVLSAALVAPLAQYDYATVQAVLDESHAIRGIDYLAVRDAAGVTVATSGWPVKAPLPAVDEKFVLDDDDDSPRYDVAVPIAVAGQALGTLQFGLDLRRILVARQVLLSQGALIGAGELLISAGLLTLLGLLITRQLKVLTQASLKVAQGELSTEPVPEGSDDVGRLGAAFNVMSRAIAERVEQLTRAQAETERIAVSLRDKQAQLESSNRALSGENEMRVAAQRELEVALGHISDRTAQLDAIFDLSPDGFVSFDGQRRVSYVSPAFLRMTQLRADEVLGTGEAEFSARLALACTERARFGGVAELRADDHQRADCPTADAPAVPERRPRLIEIGGPGPRVLDVQCRLAGAGGVSQILFFRDVTRETEVDRMKSEFLSHAAHELRTPMASIYGFAEVLLADRYPYEQQQEMLGIIHRQSEAMVNIINELLDLVRIDARMGKDFHFAEVDADRLLREVAADFGVPAQRDPPVIEASAPGHAVRADAGKLAQAVRNILSNAYKYSPQGGEVGIGLCLDPAPEAADGRAARVGIRVRDQGIGMTPEQTRRACERFYRADSSGQIPGTGLGMSIVEEILRVHGGTVEIRSRLGQGSTVTLWLPALAPGGPAAAAAAPAPAAEATGPAGPPASAQATALLS